MRGLAGIVVTICLVSAAAACGGDSNGPLIDEHAGTVDGVGLGDSLGDVRRACGKPGGGPHVPTTDVGLPWIVAPPPDRRRDEQPAGAAYRDMDFLAFERTGVYSVPVWRQGARTKAGVQLGDPLEEARDEYDGLRCDIRNENSEYPSYPYGTGRVGGNFIWFGQDPIRSISLLTTAPG